MTEEGSRFVFGSRCFCHCGRCTAIEIADTCRRLGVCSELYARGKSLEVRVCGGGAVGWRARALCTSPTLNVNALVLLQYRSERESTAAQPLLRLVLRFPNLNVEIHNTAAGPSPRCLAPHLGLAASTSTGPATSGRQRHARSTCGRSAASL